MDHSMGNHFIVFIIFGPSNVIYKDDNPFRASGFLPYKIVCAYLWIRFFERNKTLIYITFILGNNYRISFSTCLNLSIVKADSETEKRTSANGSDGSSLKVRFTPTQPWSAISASNL